MPPRFHNPLVRDLAWVAASPALLDGQLLPMRDPLQDSVWRQDPDQLWHQLSLLDAAPHRLAELFSDSPDRRLGSHYERLWHALLTLAPDTRILAHNIALRRGAHTLGEMDLVIQAADGAIVHLELAVKFYLGRADLHDPLQHCSAPQHWWGIDTRDTLAHKLSRLIQHQLPLSQRLPIGRCRCPRSRPPGCRVGCSRRWISQCRCQPAVLHHPGPCTGARYAP